MRAFLGEAEIGAFADHLDAKLRSVNAQSIIGPVARLGILLRCRLDIGADAAEPQEIDGRQQKRMHQFLRRCGFRR